MDQDRRQLLRNTVVVAGAVWASPVLTSVAWADGVPVGSPGCEPHDCSYSEADGCPSGCYRTLTAEGDCACFSGEICLSCQDSGDCPPGTRCGRVVNCCGNLQRVCLSLCH